jgi:hypothetical protein
MTKIIRSITEQSAENSFLLRVFDDQGKPIPVTIATTPAYQRPIVKRSSNI